MKYVDISRTIRTGMAKYLSDPPVKISQFKSLRRGNSCNLTRIDFGSHTGTHVDAPLHILEGGKGVDALKIKDLICDVVVTNSKKLIENEFFKQIKQKGIKGILLKRQKTRTGLTSKEARQLIKNKIMVIGTESMSIEAVSDKKHSIHRLLLNKGIVIVEGLNLKRAKP